MILSVLSLLLSLLSPDFCPLLLSLLYFLPVSLLSSTSSLLSLYSIPIIPTLSLLVSLLSVIPYFIPLIRIIKTLAESCVSRLQQGITNKAEGVGSKLCQRGGVPPVTIAQTQARAPPCLFPKHDCRFSE